MKFARFDVDQLPGPDTVTVRAQLKGVQGFAKDVDLLVLSRLVSRDVVELFLERGTRLAELADGNLLQIVEVGYEQGRAFLATEASAGVPIDTLLAKCKALGLESMPTPIALGVGIEVAKALVHAHAHTDINNRPDPIVHGGLRGETITIGEDGAVKLGGFEPLRAAPSIENDVEQLIEVVHTWVPSVDQNLVREAAVGVSSAADLRRAWAACLSRRWPGATPSARRTLVAFARGVATRATLESELGVAPAKASVLQKGAAIAAALALLVAALFLWVPSEQAQHKPALPAKPLLQPQVVTREPPYLWVGDVVGAKDHLSLPEQLPGIRFQEELWFSELEPEDGDAPQLFIAETTGQMTNFATVPIRPWRVPGATGLRFFSWNPFKASRNGLRSILLGSSRQKVLPLVQSWLELTPEGVRALGVPTHKTLVVEAAAADAGTPLGSLLVAVSYGGKVPSADDPRWPHQLTGMVLMAGQTSPTLENAESFAFIATDPKDHFTVTIREGANTREDLWPEARSESSPKRHPIAVDIEGHYEGFSQPEAVRFLSSCADWPEVSQNCIDQCVARYPKSYFCWRFEAMHAHLDVDKAWGARRFLDLALPQANDHPFVPYAIRNAAPTSGEAEKARPAPKSPVKP